MDEQLVDSVKLRYEIIVTYRDDSLKDCNVTLPEVIYRLDSTSEHLKAFFIDYTQLSEFNLLRSDNLIRYKYNKLQYIAVVVISYGEQIN